MFPWSKISFVLCMIHIFSKPWKTMKENNQSKLWPVMVRQQISPLINQPFTHTTTLPQVVFQPSAKPFRDTQPHFIAQRDGFALTSWKNPNQSNGFTLHFVRRRKPFVVLRRQSVSVRVQNGQQKQKQQTLLTEWENMVGTAVLVGQTGLVECRGAITADNHGRMSALPLSWELVNESKQALNECVRWACVCEELSATRGGFEWVHSYQ